MYVLVIDDPFDECKLTGFSYDDDQYEQLISDAEAFDEQTSNKAVFTALEIWHNL